MIIVIICRVNFVDIAGIIDLVKHLCYDNIYEILKLGGID
jgi:hypothetical protein